MKPGDEEPVFSVVRSDGYRRYFVNTAWMMVERVARTALTVLVGVFLLRHLGPSQYGLLSYAASVAGLFLALEHLGLDDILVRRLVQTPDDASTLLGTAFVLRLLGGAAALLAVFIYENLFGDLSSLPLIIAAGLFFRPFLVVDLRARANVEAQYSARVLVYAFFAASALKLSFVIAKAPLVAFAAALAAEHLFTALGMALLAVRRKMRCGRWRFDPQRARILMRDAWPLLLSSLAIGVHLRADQVLIKAMLDVEQVGYYAGAIRISELGYLFALTVTSSVFPAVVNGKRIGPEEYQRRMQALYDLMAWSGILFAVVTMLISAPLVELLFGVRFLPAAKPLAVHAPVRRRRGRSEPGAQQPADPPLGHQRGRRRRCRHARGHVAPLPTALFAHPAVCRAGRARVPSPACLALMAGYRQRAAQRGRPVMHPWNTVGARPGTHPWRGDK